MLSLVGVALVASVILLIASRYFAVEVDPRVEEVLALLSGANCGGCGFAGCRAYAESVVAGKAGTHLCAPGGAEIVGRIAEIAGVEAVVKEPMVARIGCAGGAGVAVKQAEYFGIPDCRTAMAIFAEEKLCRYGCMGFGTCEEVCPFGAITTDEADLPVVDLDKCTGCGVCVRECPKQIIFLAPRAKETYVRCMSHDKARAVKQACEVGCIGCKRCEKECPEGAITVTDFLATIDYEKCKDCGNCVAVCPNGTIWNAQREKEREAEVVSEGGSASL